MASPPRRQEVVARSWAVEVLVRRDDHELWVGDARRFTTPARLMRWGDWLLSPLLAGAVRYRVFASALPPTHFHLAATVGDRRMLPPIGGSPPTWSQGSDRTPDAPSPRSWTNIHLHAVVHALVDICYAHAACTRCRTVSQSHDRHALALCGPHAHGCRSDRGDPFAVSVGRLHRAGGAVDSYSGRLHFGRLH
jgi:hypothetical protein